MFKVKGWLRLFPSYLNKLIIKTIASNLHSMVTYAKTVCVQILFLITVCMLLKDSYNRIGSHLVFRGSLVNNEHRKNISLNLKISKKISLIDFYFLFIDKYAFM